MWKQVRMKKKCENILGFIIQISIKWREKGDVVQKWEVKMVKTD